MVGARSSLAAPSGPAARCSRASELGPTTRKRQGTVRWWLGAQSASSSSSRSCLVGSGSGAKALWVRRVRIAVSTSIARGYLATAALQAVALAHPDPAAAVARRAEQAAGEQSERRSGNRAAAGIVLLGGGRGCGGARLLAGRVRSGDPGRGGAGFGRRRHDATRQGGRGGAARTRGQSGNRFATARAAGGTRAGAGRGRGSRR